MEIFISLEDQFNDELRDSINALCNKLPEYLKPAEDSKYDSTVSLMIETLKEFLYSEIVDRIIMVNVTDQPIFVAKQFDDHVRKAVENIDDLFDCPVPDPKSNLTKVAFLPSSADVLVFRCLPHDEIKYILCDYKPMMEEINKWARNLTTTMTEKFCHVFHYWIYQKCD